MIEGVYVKQMVWGQKYLFAEVSIPDEWIDPDRVMWRRDLGVLLAEWHGAWLRERQRAGSSQQPSSEASVESRGLVPSVQSLRGV